MGTSPACRRTQKNVRTALALASVPAGVSLSAAAGPRRRAKRSCCAGGGYTLCAANTSKDESRFDYQLEDQRIRDSALGHLELAAERLASADKDVEGSKGFFIGAGFHKPHVPFVFPAEFLQYVPEDLADIPLAEDTYAPIGMPDAAWHFPADVHGFPIKFNGTCNETRSRNFRRGYYAAVSYTVSSARSLLNSRS